MYRHLLTGYFTRPPYSFIALDTYALWGKEEWRREREREKGRTELRL